MTGNMGFGAETAVRSDVEPGFVVIEVVFAGIVTGVFFSL